MRICVITILAARWGGTWETALYTVEVWVLGVGMSTLGAQTALYAEDRGLQVPMAHRVFVLERIERVCRDLVD